MKKHILLRSGSRRTVLLQLSLIIGVAISAIALQSYAANSPAFVQPSVAPPGGNAFAPLNVGRFAQSKSGGLILNNAAINPAKVGLWVEHGVVAIGETPNVSGAMLQVNGSIKISDTSTNTGIAGASCSGLAGTIKFTNNNFLACTGNNTWKGLTNVTLSCTSFTYSSWTPSVCSSSGTQTRNVISSSPVSCTGGSPVTTRSCTYVPPPTKTFTYTGTTQTYTVPTGVSSVRLRVWGAQGGSGGASRGTAAGGPGGYGGYAEGVLKVHAGQVLRVHVGGNPYNGGGSSGPIGGNNGPGGYGGGASDVRNSTLPTSLSYRIIVAGGGGGGGGGGRYSSRTGGAGGAGGGYSGTIGATAGGGGGGGGTNRAGGSAGTNGKASAGQFGYGGRGGSDLTGNGGAAGGGGGGGYYGGGGGGGGYYDSGAGGGGGGSSYIGFALTSGTTRSGIKTGNGEVIIIPQ